MNLFNIEKEYLELIDNIELNDGVIEEDEAKQLEILEQELDKKLHAYYYIIKQKQGEVQLLKDEIQRFNKLIESKENTITRLREAVLNATLLFGADGKSGNKQIKYHDLNIYTVNKKGVTINENEFKDERFNKYTINVDNNVFIKIKNSLPEESWKSSVDKTKLNDAVKQGLQIEGVEEVINTHVVMR